MTDFIEDFENFINEICGPDSTGPNSEQKDRSRRWKIEKDHFRDLHNLEEFMAYRKELDFLIGGCHQDIYKCGRCKEKYEIYLKPELLNYEDYYSGFNGETSPAAELKRNRYFCVKCGMPFYVNGEVRFMRNKGFPRIAVTEDDGTI